MTKFKSASLAVLSVFLAATAFAEAAEVGPRPYFLIDQMADSDLKSKLLACAGKPL